MKHLLSHVPLSGEGVVGVEPGQSLGQNGLVFSSCIHTTAFTRPPHTPRGTVLLGFEQANKYTIYNEHGQVVALLAEDDSILRTVSRQVFRTRRPFTATVLSPDGTEILFRIQRPFYLLASHARIVSADGNTILGEIFGRWHLWRRNYDLYIDRKQFAAIRGGLWAWDFELTDAQGKPLALIDRNFQVMSCFGGGGGTVTVGSSKHKRNSSSTLLSC